MKGQPPRPSEDDANADRERRHAFAVALDQVARDLEISHAEMARRLGFAQQTVSKWITGERPPENPLVVFDVERKLGLVPGFLSHHLGFVPVNVVDTPSAISRDPMLSPAMKRNVLNMYRTLVAIEQRWKPPEESDSGAA